MKKILFVDDELQILRALCRVFMDTDYAIFKAESGQEALDFLKSNYVDMIITDMRMPYMDGYELLSQVKKLYPDIIRIILSGYSDEKVIFKALEKNIARLYIMKPWENDKLLKTIEEIFKTEEVLISTNLLTLINGTEYLPTIESSYQRILRLIDNGADLSKIAEEIERDQSISSKILHVSNSAYFNAKTWSIKEAITFIGINNTRSLVFSTSIMEGFKAEEIVRKKIEIVWKHAVITNKLLNYIYIKYLDKSLSDALLLTGLLHNIGIVLLLSNFGEEYLSLIEDARTKRVDVLEFEFDKYQLSHNEAGGYLLKWWEFPSDIVEAAIYHHNPLDDNVKNRELVCALHIAQKYAWNLMKMESFEKFDLRVFDVLKIIKNDFEDSLSAFVF